MPSPNNGDVFASALENIEGEPVAYLEQWSNRCWIYVEKDSLREIEPENTIESLDG